jgi:hypothetical protein
VGKSGITPKQFFEALGFTATETKGGGEALLTAGRGEGKAYMMVTAADDVVLPTDWDNLTVACYDSNDELVWFA